MESPHSAAAVAPYRRFAVGATALASLGAPLLNAQLARVWSAVRVTPWFRNDMFEPLVAVGSFFVWIHLWFGVDWLASSGRAPGLRKYQIVPKKAAGIDDGRSIGRRSVHQRTMGRRPTSGRRTAGSMRTWGSATSCCAPRWKRAPRVCRLLWSSIPRQADPSRSSCRGLHEPTLPHSRAHALRYSRDLRPS